MYGQVEPYIPPQWAECLKNIPKTRVNLSMNNTPIHPWNIPGLPGDFSVSIKREDMTGSVLTGNKVRKLEFILADAIGQGCSHVIACGALQSNHCRAVAASARQLNMTPHLFLKSDARDLKSAECKGNFLLDRLCGSVIHLVPKVKPDPKHPLQDMRQFAKDMEAKGEKCYVIPQGGSCLSGVFGYIHVFHEMEKQGVLDDYDDVFFTVASGGMAVGLAIANYLTGQHLKLHAISVREDASTLYDHCDEAMQEIGQGHLQSRDLIRIVDTHRRKGYGISTPEEFEFIHQIASHTGIVLDPNYTGKTTLGMVNEIKHNPTAFKGRRVLYLHTGGIFGLFDGRMEPYLENNQD